MLKNHWFLKLWGLLDRDENDFDSFLHLKYAKGETKPHPRKWSHGPLLAASALAPGAYRALATYAEAIDRELLAPKIKKGSLSPAGSKAFFDRGSRRASLKLYQLN